MPMALSKPSVVYGRSCKRRPNWLPARERRSPIWGANNARDNQPARTLSYSSSSKSTYVIDEPKPTALESMSSMDEDARNFRFLPSQLTVFAGLVSSMKNCSRALATLGFGNMVVNAFEAVEKTHAHGHGHAADAAASAHSTVAAAAAAGSTTSDAVAAAAEVTASAGPGFMAFCEELARSVSLYDAAFCVNELIPALLIMYAIGPFAELSRNPDEPHMALALKGVGRLSLTLQQLAWTSGSVGVVLLAVAAAEYPPIVGVASATCLALAVARGMALVWVLSAHTSSGAEVSRTLAALRGGKGAAQMNPLDRAASWLALGALLQAEPPLHAGDHTHSPGGGHSALKHSGAVLSHHQVESAVSPAAAAALLKPHYSFSGNEERLLRSLVEAANAAGLATSLQVLATLALGIAHAAADPSAGWMSSIIIAAQKSANAAALFTSASAFDKALHNDDGNDDTDHLLTGLGSDHSGMSGLFGSIAVLSLALTMAGAVALLVPSLEDSPLGVLLGDGLVHMSADLLVEVLEAL